ncbi:Plasma membrane proteolipid 3 [Colletotrichum orbiculare MAFF 240422]|uniref:Plasma membrane proteolipid 3 n=1 Tax=Colletotrichum orbiculare (strain 104-T / ATCC 96160 / CBS 514.97 / LARS 414 / MAFF 240422) TaxID=1213857 RepID=A0A484FIL2_COLOR|nr:Plasma membrane proteolipid 3 [Colletotrichum orbiculare MAFF 240422]
MGAISAIFLILITIVVPPVGVYAVAGCGMDLLVNICLTILGYIPGHIHAFYVEYVYYDRREQAREGRIGDDMALSKHK